MNLGTETGETPTTSPSSKGLSLGLGLLLPYLAFCPTLPNPKPSNPQTLKPSNPQTLKPSNPQTLKPSNPQTLKPSNPQTLKPSNPQTLKPSNPQTLKPSNPQTLKPSNPQTLNPQPEIHSHARLRQKQMAGPNRASDMEGFRV